MLDKETEEWKHKKIPPCVIRKEEWIGCAAGTTSTMLHCCFLLSRPRYHSLHCGVHCLRLRHRLGLPSIIGFSYRLFRRFGTRPAPSTRRGLRRPAGPRDGRAFSAAESVPVNCLQLNKAEASSVLGITKFPEVAFTRSSRFAQLPSQHRCPIAAQF